MFTLHFSKPNPNDPTKVMQEPSTTHQSLASARAIALRKLAGCPAGPFVRIYTQNTPPRLKLTAVVESDGRPVARLVPEAA